MSFVIRLCAKVGVMGKNYSGLLSKYPLKEGELVDLGICVLSGDVECRIVGVWKRGEKEPWWLCSSLNIKAVKAIKYYQRRPTIECFFRDIKGCRFGAKLKWTKYRDPEDLNRLFLLVGIAHIFWTLAGAIASLEDKTLLQRNKKRGQGRSLASIGKNQADILLRLLKKSIKSILKYLPKLFPTTPILAKKTVHW